MGGGTSSLGVTPNKPPPPSILPRLPPARSDPAGQRGGRGCTFITNGCKIGTGWDSVSADKPVVVLVVNGGSWLAVVDRENGDGTWKESVVPHDSLIKGTASSKTVQDRLFLFLLTIGGARERVANTGLVRRPGRRVSRVKAVVVVLLPLIRQFGAVLTGWLAGYGSYSSSSPWVRERRWT